MVCRQQIALDVRLDRLGGTPWGFRLVGGAGYKVPLTVVQVEAGSPAARGGLADGDEVLSISGVSARDITHDAAHDIIVAAPLRIELAVVRILSTPPTEESSGLSPNPTIDTLLPSSEVPIPPHDRSRTSSPFIHVAKPFRPFSAEPFDGIPPIEKPIILSPFYHDDFSKLKKKEVPPPTKFKLEINKDYVPEDDRSVAESYSKIQDTTQLTSLEELNKELDLQQIENTVGFVSDESMKEFTASGEMKTIDYESTSEENKIMEITEIVGKTVDATNVSASLLAQLIDQTADEISNSKTAKDTSEVKESFIVASESEVKASSKFETKMKSNSTESVSKEISLQSEEHSSVNKSIEFREEIEKHQVEQSEKFTKSVAAKSESQTSEYQQSIDEHSQSAKEIIQSINQKTIEEKMESGARNVEEKKKQAKKEISECKREVTVKEIKNKQQIEGATRSLTEIKQHAISTANLLAEQRAYTLGLQTIPNIQGHAHSSYHYDLLLKTFFIHLTDVMVALSRIILSEGVSRSNSPMPVKNEETKPVLQQISTQTTTQEETSIQSNQLETKAELETKKMTAAKFAQMSQSKTEEMTQKMDAVITEFKKDVEEQDHIEVSHSVRGKSISKIEEEVLKENDPLEWLAKVDESKSTCTTDEATVRKDSGTDYADDLAGKIIYVATVEAHQISNIEDIDSAMTESVATESSAVEISSEKAEEIVTQSEAVVTQAEQVTVQAVEVTKGAEEVTTHAEETTMCEERKLSQEHTLIAQETSMSSIAHESIESAQICAISQQTIVQETSISKEASQSIAIEMNKLESMTQESKLKNTIATSQYADENHSSTTVDDRRQSKVETPLQSRKSSSEAIDQPESVRNPDLSLQVSVTSEDSYKPVPQTPLTDEYVFRLQMHLDETKNPLPPSPPVEHEDPYTVKKPKLIPHIETSIESALYGDPEKELTDASPAKIDKVADTNAFPGKVDKIADANAFPGKLERITDTAAPPAKAIKEVAPKTNFNESKGAAAFPGTNDTTAPPVLSTIAHIVTSVAESATNIVNLNASNIELSQTLATNIEKESAATTHGARSTSAKLVEEALVQDTLLEERRKSAILTSSIDTTIESIERYKQDAGMETCAQSNGRQYDSTAVTGNGFASEAIPGTQASFIKQNCGLIKKHYGVVTHHGGIVKRVIQDGGAEQDGGRIANGVVDGTTRGIVDSLDNAGILDQEVAKQLGRPGLSDDKIAELISGEAEMLKEAHVIGVDFKKIKPHIEALKDSEVLRALNDELAKTKEEKKKEDRKYTTFLQRPDRAVPRSRFGYVRDPEVLEEPYKIQIVRQPKPRVAPDYEPQDFETGPLPWEARAANEPPVPPAPREDPVLVPEEAPLYLEALDNLPESEVPDLEDTGIPLPPPAPATSEPHTPPASPTEETSEAEQTEGPSETELSGQVETGSDQQEPEEQGEEMQAQLAERILGSIQSMVDPAASMEEQLLQMRAQLAALAQLPGVITQTLELVTEQLGQLTKQEKEMIQSESAVTVTEIEEEEDTTCVQESADVAQESPEVPLACETEVNANGEDVAEPPARAASPAARQLLEQNVDVAQADPGEQNKIDAQKKELMAELQKEHEQRQVKQRATPRVAPARPKPAFGPRVPSERPLVLPGGRRWRSEKDAFNEDFIRETLASQAEVIQGKTKGCQYESIRLPYDERINFMKWEKPAKTLDYLKDSDVYKLVHDMDAAPGRQVDRLPSVALSESEYRESRIREILQDSKIPPQKHQVRFAPSETFRDALPATCGQICECPEACGGVLPDVCAAKRHAACDAKKLGKQQLVCEVNKVASQIRPQDGGPVVKELIVPRAAPQESAPPRQISHAEAVEIVTNYLETYAHAQSRGSPAIL